MMMSDPTCPHGVNERRINCPECTNEEIQRLRGVERNYLGMIGKKESHIIALEDALKEIESFNMDAECLPLCDSHGHEKLCPYVNPEYVMADIARQALKGKEDV
jgi:hypothetical protein